MRFHQDFILYFLYFLILAPLSAHALTFKYLGSPLDSVLIMSDLNKWGQIPWKMQDIGKGTFEFSIPEPYAKKILYKFLINGEWTLDPLNKLREPDGHGGYNSVVISKFLEDPLLLRSPRTPNWPVYVRTFKYKNVDRNVFEISPVISNKDFNREIVTVYFQDGLDYYNKARVKTLLENLSLDTSLPLFRAILIPPLDRFKEYTFDKDYAHFVARELVNFFEPYQSGKRVITGASLGGLASLYIALLYPQTFPFVAGQSSSFWFDDHKILNLLKSSSILPKKVYLKWGSFETADILGSNEKMHAMLNESNVLVFAKTDPAIHNWFYWKNSLSEMLIRLFKN